VVTRKTIKRGRKVEFSLSPRERAWRAMSAWEQALDGTAMEVVAHATRRRTPDAERS
jgi:hypothetical protein